jgi:hypothetical protein
LIFYPPPPPNFCCASLFFFFPSLSLIHSLLLHLFSNEKDKE